MKQNYKTTTFLIAEGAMIAAAYVALTLAFAPFSFKEIQVRIAEALAILPMFTPAAVPGLAVGCLLGNILGGAVVADVIFGTIATLIGAVGTRALRNRRPGLAVIPPIAANTLIVPFVLRYAYGIPLPIPLMMLPIGIGETLSCGVLGALLYKVLSAHRKSIFKSD